MTENWENFHKLMKDFDQNNTGVLNKEGFQNVFINEVYQDEIKVGQFDFDYLIMKLFEKSQDLQKLEYGKILSILKEVVGEI